MTGRKRLLDWGQEERGSLEKVAVAVLIDAKLRTTASIVSVKLAVATQPQTLPYHRYKQRL